MGCAVFFAVSQLFAAQATAPFASTFFYEGTLVIDDAPAVGVFELQIGLAADDVAAPFSVQTFEQVPVDDGAFAVALDLSEAPAPVLEGGTFTIELSVDGVPLLGRQQVLPVPFAMHAPLPAALVAQSLSLSGAPGGVYLQNGGVTWAMEIESDGDLSVDGVNESAFKIESDAPFSALRVNGPDGDIGMGTDTPAAALHLLRVDGGARVFVEEASPSAGQRTLLWLRNNGPTRLTIDNTDDATPWNVTALSSGDLAIGDGALGVPQMQLAANGNVTIAGSLTQNSDARLKQNIREIPRALESVLALRGVRFERLGGGRTEIGVVAQDVERVFPEAVVKDDAGTRAVAYANLVAPLIEAVRVLDAERRAQDQKIEQLEARLARLEAASAR